MSNKVFVGGLSWDTDNSSLRLACEAIGAVNDVKVITDHESGRSRGFGFVTFEKSESVAKAISVLDGQLLDGRTVRVNEAVDKPRPARSAY